MTKTLTPIEPSALSAYTAPVRVNIGAMPKVDPIAQCSTVLMQTLLRALTVKRGADGPGEAAFVAWLCNRLPVSMIDGAGNIHVDMLGSTGRTLFTAHTDTVHHKEGVNSVRIDAVTEPGQTFWRADGDALGSDDGAGVALLVHMIDNAVPGYYVFFRGEECGGVGSKHLAKNMPGLFKQFDRAVAFDRAGYYDVITHQAGGRCCSDTFAQALADQFNAADADFFYAPDNTGVYTDTAEFIGLVPECTNISVGYFSQHGDRENTNVTFLTQLADAVVKVQWDALPTERTPTKDTYSKYGKFTLSTVDDDWAKRLGTPDDIDYEDPQATEVLEALEYAIDGDTRMLLDMMCEAAAYIYALDNANEAMHYIRAGRLTADVCDDSMKDLIGGTDADLILTDLYDYCCN